MKSMSTSVVSTMTRKEYLNYVAEHGYSPTWKPVHKKDKTSTEKK